MAFTGDHSAFTGDYYIQGRAQIAPATFSPLAGIKLADGNIGFSNGILSLPQWTAFLLKRLLASDCAQPSRT